MEVKRRGLLRFALAAGALLLLPLARLLPARVLTAVRGRRYPGPVAALDPARMRRPARWSG